MTTSQFFMKEFKAIDDYLQAVRDILQNGHMPDMASLDQRVASLCIALQEAPSEIQQQCLPKLSDLLKRLDICEVEIRAYQAAQTRGHS